MTDNLLPELLEGVPVPLLLTHEGTLTAFNAAATALFPALTVGGTVPVGLEHCRPGTAAVLETEGGMFLVTARSTSGGDLLTLLPKPTLHVSTAALTAQLREKLSMAMSAVQVLSPTIEESAGQNAQQYLNYLNKGLYQLLRIVKNLEQADGGQTPYQPAAVDLVVLTAAVYEQAEPLCASAGVALRYECKLPHLVTTGDADKLIHMLSALLSNAVKSAGQGGEILLRLTEIKNRAILMVRDNGPGLTEADLAAYWSGTAPEPRVGAGLGLGLPLVRYLARLHDGAVMLDAGHSNGLTATVSLPIAPPAPGLLRARVERNDNFPAILIELSDVLPGGVFHPRNFD